MSIWINVDLVEAVLLQDGWHEIRGKGMGLDAYEFIWWGDASVDWTEAREYRRTHKDGDPHVLLGGGREPLIPATGFYFTCRCGRLAGPLTSIMAVRYRDESEFDDDDDGE